jgi:hypothetical protein
MKTIMVKLWKSGTIRVVVQIIIFGSVVLYFRGIKDESAWGDFYCKIEVPSTVLTDTTEFWSKDVKKENHYISACKFEGDTSIRVRFADFRDDANISLANPHYQQEDFWWYDLAMGTFSAKSGDRWEISLEQEDGSYFIITRRLLITQTYVGSIFATGFLLGFLVCIFWNGIFPRGTTTKKEQ